METLPKIISLGFVFLTTTLADETFNFRSGFSSSAARAKTMTVGEKLTLTWSGFHNVYQMKDEAAFNSCSFSGSSYKGGSSGVQLTVTEGTTYYACRVGSHCRSGMKLALTGESSAESTTLAPPTTSTSTTTTTSTTTADPCTDTTCVDWMAGYSDDDAQYMAVAPGTLITLQWPGVHNVWKLKNKECFDACDFTDAIQYGTESPYTLPAAEEGVAYYACTIGDHCEQGQKLALDGGVILDWTAGFHGEAARSLVIQDGRPVTLQWSNVHNVIKMKDQAAFDTCDFTDSQFLAHESPFTFFAADGDYYACSMTVDGLPGFSNHCEMGQKLAVMNEKPTTTTAEPATVTVTTKAACPSTCTTGNTDKKCGWNMCKDCGHCPEVTTQAPEENCPSTCTSDADKIAKKCKWNMCKDCSVCESITEAPEETCPAKCTEDSDKIATRCKWSMCKDVCSVCTSSTEAPAPTCPAKCTEDADKIATRCKWSMCSGCGVCSSSTEAPAPTCPAKCTEDADKIATRCKWGMCSDCTVCESTEAPEETCPAKCTEDADKIATRCKWSMCSGCTVCESSTEAPASGEEEETTGECKSFCTTSSNPNKCNWSGCAGCDFC